MKRIRGEWSTSKQNGKTESEEEEYMRKRRRTRRTVADRQWEMAEQ